MGEKRRKQSGEKEDVAHVVRQESLKERRRSLGTTLSLNILPTNDQQFDDLPHAAEQAPNAADERVRDRSSLSGSVPIDLPAHRHHDRQHDEETDATDQKRIVLLIDHREHEAEHQHHDETQ